MKPALRQLDGKRLTRRTASPDSPEVRFEAANPVSREFECVHFYGLANRQLAAGWHGTGNLSMMDGDYGGDKILGKAEMVTSARFRLSETVRLFVPSH